MDVILLERIAKLGLMGETVSVKPGYARNYLFPQGKALRATKENLERFQSQRAELETKDLERRQAAEKIAEQLANKTFLTVRAAAETGQLYGSVSSRDISEILKKEGFSIARSQLQMHEQIKVVGLHSVGILLHPEVSISITINAARSADEGERQLKSTQTVAETEVLEDSETEVLENVEDEITTDSSDVIDEE